MGRYQRELEGDADKDKTPSKEQNRTAKIAGLYAIIGAVVGAILTAIFTKYFVF
jgi:hypothetical protein